MVIALGHLEAKASIATLKVMAQDNDLRIKANAVESLGKIGEPEVWPFLVRFLEDEN